MNYITLKKYRKRQNGSFIPLDRGRWHFGVFNIMSLFDICPTFLAPYDFLLWIDSGHETETSSSSIRSKKRTCVRIRVSMFPEINRSYYIIKVIKHVTNNIYRLSHYYKFNDRFFYINSKYFLNEKKQHFFLFSFRENYLLLYCYILFILRFFNL